MTLNTIVGNYLSDEYQNITAGKWSNGDNTIWIDAYIDLSGCHIESITGYSVGLQELELDGEGQDA